jgi:hypothetical protein
MMTDKDRTIKPDHRSPDEMADRPSAETGHDSNEAKAKPPEFLLPHEGFE